MERSYGPCRLLSSPGSRVFRAGWRCRVGSRILSFRWTLLDEGLLAARIACHDCDPHFHDTYTIGLVRAGTVHLAVGADRFVATAGDVFVIHPYEVHSGGDKAEPIECDILYPSIRVMTEITSVDCGFGMFPNFGSPVIARCAQSEALFNVIGAAIESSETPQSEEICGALRGLFDGRIKGGRRLKIAGQPSASVYRAFDAMLDHLELLRGAADLSGHLGISRFHFIRTFHKAVGMPPAAFLRQLRVARAKSLITSGLPLADAAIDSGFVDQAHMTREFKSVFGFPPGKLARSIRHHRALARLASETS
jgi:AraC-like DNA-binding protein